MKTTMTLIAAALLGTTAALPLGAQTTTVTTPEGAQMDVPADLAYKPGQLTQAQLMSSTRDLFRQNSVNVFRRFQPDKTAQMVKFYTQALALRSLNPIQLTSTQQMLLTGVGSGQIKLSAGQQGNRKYVNGGYKAATGLRLLTLTYPDAAAVAKRFTDAGFAAPAFTDQGDGTKAALVSDPGGFSIEIVIKPGAKDHSDDGVGVSVSVSDLQRSRAFYREFVGLDELPPVKDKVLGVTKYPYRHQETTIYLYKLDGAPVPADTGSAGIQYVISDAAMADAKGKARQVAVETPLNKLRGFDLTTVWLNDPDGVTNYYAQPGRASRQAAAATN